MGKVQIFSKWSQKTLFPSKFEFFRRYWWKTILSKWSQKIFILLEILMILRYSQNNDNFIMIRVNGFFPEMLIFSGIWAKNSFFQSYLNKPCFSRNFNIFSEIGKKKDSFKVISKKLSFSRNVHDLDIKNDIFKMIWKKVFS